YAKQGLILGEALPPSAVIAAAWLGAPSYFSSLKAIDLLGKTDKHVASLPGTGPFMPGHNKMDLNYSIGVLKPDVVLLDDVRLKGLGYLRLPNGIWVSQTSPRLHKDSIDRLASWCEWPTCAGDVRLANHDGSIDK